MIDLKVIYTTLKSGRYGVCDKKETLSEIGLTLDRNAGSISSVLKLKAGISPV